MVKYIINLKKDIIIKNNYIKVKQKESLLCLFFLVLVNFLTN